MLRAATLAIVILTASPALADRWFLIVPPVDTEMIRAIYGTLDPSNTSKAREAQELLARMEAAPDAETRRLIFRDAVVNPGTPVARRLIFGIYPTADECRTEKEAFRSDLNRLIWEGAESQPEMVAVIYETVQGAADCIPAEVYRMAREAAAQ